MKPVKKALFILAENNFRDAEYIVPRSFLEQHGIVVNTTSSGEISKGRFGFEVKIDLLLSSLSPEALNSFDALVFVGGGGSLDYMENTRLKSMTINYIADSSKIVAAICAAPRLLLAWGILKGKSCVGSNFDAKFEGFCNSYGAVAVKDKNVFRAGQIITATGPESVEVFALEVINAL